MAIRTRNFKSLVWTTSLKVVFFHVLIFVLIGYEFTQGSNHVLFTLFFWAGNFLSYFEIAPKNRQGNKNAKEQEAFRRKSKPVFSDRGNARSL